MFEKIDFENDLEFIKAYEYTNQEYKVICEKFLENNVNNFCFVEAEHLTKQDYFNLALFAVEKNGYSFTSVQPEFLPNPQVDYLKLCKLHLLKHRKNTFYPQLEWVKVEYLNPKDYRSLCKDIILNYSIYELKYIQKEFFSKNEYLSFFKKAFERKDFWIIEFADANYFPNKDDYYNLCKFAIQNCPTGETLLSDLKPEFLTEFQYFELSNLAIDLIGVWELNSVKAKYLEAEHYLFLARKCSYADYLRNNWHIEYLPLNNQLKAKEAISTTDEIKKALAF